MENSQVSANNSQKRCKIGPKLLLMTNRKSHTPFDWCQNQRPWMTLNGRYALHCRKDASFGAHHKNLNEDRPILSAAEMQANDSSFFRWGSLERGRVKRQWGNRKRRFSRILDATSSAPQEMRPTLLYSIIQSLVAFPVTPKYMTLSDPDWLFRVKFCFFAPVQVADTLRLRKITYCQRCKSSSVTLVSGNIWFVQIFGRVLQKGDVKGQWGRALTLVLNTFWLSKTVA